MADNTNFMNKNKYMAQNIANEPEFYESLFPFSTVPQLETESSSVSLNLPKKIFITDTTFRDGEQSRVPYTLDQTLALFDFLHELGGPNGIIEMTEFFVYSKRNREFIKQCQEREYAFPRITGWIRANLNDLKHVKELKLEETGILASISDYHISHKLNGTRQEILGRYLDVVEATLEANIIPRVHLEDVTRADMQKVVVPFVNTLRILSDYYDLPVKIRLPDTLGIGLPFPEAGLPRSIPKLVSMLRNDCDMPAEWIEFHGHNDFYMAVANSTAAWLYGAGGVNCTLLGIGERTGNTPLEAMIMTYLSLTGKNSKINTKIITDIAEYYQNNIGYSIPVHQPFVGENFNTTRAGIHADGLIKNPRVYLSYNTTEMLGRPARVAITHTSGTAGIAYWIKTHFKESNIIISKRSSSVEKIHSLIQHQYETGRVTAISDIEMYKFIEDCFPELSSSSVKTL